MQIHTQIHTRTLTHSQTHTHSQTYTHAAGRSVNAFNFEETETPAAAPGSASSSGWRTTETEVAPAARLLWRRRERRDPTYISASRRLLRESRSPDSSRSSTVNDMIINLSTTWLSTNPAIKKKPKTFFFCFFVGKRSTKCRSINFPRAKLLSSS